MSYKLKIVVIELKSEYYRYFCNCFNSLLTCV
nr:MAG TPA: hypothetical protein [Caudoviricetes sp.]